MANYNSILDKVITSFGVLEDFFPEGCDNNFISILVPIFRRTMHNARSILILINQPFHLGEDHNDSATSLIRKSLEDFITVKYILAFDRDKLTKKFLDHAEGEFTETINLIKKYEEDKSLTGEDIKRITSMQSRSWCGIRFEDQLHKLSEDRTLQERDKSLFYIAYHLSSRTLHTSGFDIKRFLGDENMHQLSELHLKNSLIFINIVILELAKILIQEYKDNNLWDIETLEQLEVKITQLTKESHQ